MLKFLEMLRNTKLFQSSEAGNTAFQKKYGHFQNLLAGNNHALQIITDLEQICYGNKPFSLDTIYGQAELLLSQTRNIAGELNALSGGKYRELLDSAERIGGNILQDLAKKRTVEKTGLTIPLQYLSLGQVSEVGGKAANLGEIANRVHLPVPPGFAITAYACHYFMSSNNLYAESEKILKGLDVDNTERLLECSRKVQERILETPLPPDLEAGILAEVDTLMNKFGPGIRLAVRSSATGEDSEASFAGQHSSVLGANRESVVRAYKEVVASTFNPRAIYYRRGRGYPDDYVVMSVLCLGMVHAKASGVMYTRDPNDNRRDVVLVNAVWGLAGAVDGSSATDYYEVEKAGRQVLTARTAEKATMFVLGDDGGIKVEPVDQELRTKPCIDSEQLMSLVECGLTLEEHYGVPLDIEWAMRRRDNKLVLLQARPLNLDFVSAQSEDAKHGCEAEELRKKFPRNEVLLQGGMTASRGKACGLSYVLTSDHNLLNIPEGVILIAPETSPRYVSILGRVQAIVTDVGSVTGHMASVAREFSVPTLVGTGNATKVIPNGEEITVDATNSVIFKGRVESILERKKPTNPMKDSPIYKSAHSALKKIAILHLLDPKDQNFSPRGCSTLHDIIRFAHEMSMREMFRISDELNVDEGFAVRIRARLPMEMFAVDLGGGLNMREKRSVAEVGDVTSAPFQALLRGMTHPGVRWVGSIGIDLKGLASVFAHSLVDNPDPAADSSFGGPTYVVISGEYLNFNSRLGYHFAVVDAYCGPKVNDNYITFSFKGGAADIGRRSRRAQLIANILKRLGLKTEIRGDMIRGEIKKYECELIQEKLDMIGRLLGAVRLLDMVLSDEGQIDWYVNEFFNGNYTFERPDPTTGSVKK